MKHVKRVAGLVLAMVMVLALSAGAFAAGTNSITVTDAHKDASYNIYKMLDLSVSADNTAYAYTVNEKWNGFFHAPGAGAAYVTIENGYVTWNTDKNTAEEMEAFAKAAEQYVTTNAVAASAEEITASADGTITFSNLESGYYLITSSYGTLAMVLTTPKNPDATIAEKNKTPTNEKQVEEDSTGAYGETNDADIGQVVNFQSTITAQKGAENYVFHDKMSAGLTYGGVTGITLNGKTVETSSYAVKTEDFKDGCTFEVVFTKAFCDTLNANDKIVISYTATVNKNAVVGTTGNSNESRIEYGESGKTHITPPSETKTYTWEIKVFKYTQKENEKEALAGAKFVLYKNVGETKNYVVADASNKVTGWTEDKNAATVFTTPDSGRFTISGLDRDTYYLEETEAPAGYNKLNAPVTVTIGESGVVNATTENTAGVSEVEVLNQTGTELPSTGGMGTTVFYILGSVLVLGAAVVLVTRKRMKERS